MDQVALQNPLVKGETPNAQLDSFMAEAAAAHRAAVKATKVPELSASPASAPAAGGGGDATAALLKKYGVH